MINKLGWGYYGIDTEGIALDPDAGQRVDRLIRESKRALERSINSVRPRKPVSRRVVRKAAKKR